MSVQFIQELLQSQLIVHTTDLFDSDKLWKIEWFEGTLADYNDDGDHPYGWLIAAKASQVVRELAEWHFARYREWTQDDSWDSDYEQGSDEDIQAYLVNAGWNPENIWACVYLGTASDDIEKGVLNELC